MTQHETLALKVTAYLDKRIYFTEAVMASLEPAIKVSTSVAGDKVFVSVGGYTYRIDVQEIASEVFYAVCQKTEQERGLSPSACPNCQGSGHVPIGTPYAEFAKCDECGGGGLA